MASNLGTFDPPTSTSSALLGTCATISNPKVFKGYSKEDPSSRQLQICLMSVKYKSSPQLANLITGMGGSFCDRPWSQDLSRQAPPCDLTCMMSMPIACVWTPSTLFISQCTTSALMKQHGERPFCSDSSWTPVLDSNEWAGNMCPVAIGKRKDRK